MRRYQKWLSVGLLALVPGVASAGLMDGAPNPGTSNPGRQGAKTAQAKQNQELANRVGSALKKAQLNGHDISVSTQNGRVILDGTVESTEQRAAASKACARVKGVTGVSNRLQVAGPVVQAGAVRQAGMIQQTAAQAPMAMPAYGQPDATGGHMIYNQPNLPGYSWPTYSQYPNYASVTYPTQYSASAWPYIGPFYPYPQVPLNWRKATLEWTEGTWNLSFDNRTNKWYSFLNPGNW